MAKEPATISTRYSRNAIRSADYKAGYSAGYQARGNKELPKIPDPQWISAVVELAKRIGQEPFAKLARSASDAHIKSMLDQCEKHSPNTILLPLKKEMEASIDPVVRRIEGIYGKPKP